MISCEDLFSGVCFSQKSGCKDIQSVFTKNGLTSSATWLGLMWLMMIVPLRWSTPVSSWKRSFDQIWFDSVALWILGQESPIHVRVRLGIACLQRVNEIWYFQVDKPLCSMPTFCQWKTYVAKECPDRVKVRGHSFWTCFFSPASKSAYITLSFFSILLTHEGSHREAYRDFQPSLTSSAGGAKGWSDHRFRAPPAYTAQLPTLHQHRANNQYRTANQI